jgi:hypothetical protein
MMLGAGVSTELGLPTWSKLVELISRHQSVNGVDLCVGSNPSENTERLYQHFREHYKAKLDQSQSDVWRDRTCDAKWKDIVRTCLYAAIIYDTEEIPETLSEDDCQKVDRILSSKIPTHSYLSSIYQIVREASYTITYNFDDVLERLILGSLSQRERTLEGRGYETFVNPNSSTRRQNSRIYHPNGFLPLNKLEGSSDAITLRETDLISQLLPRQEAETRFLKAHLRSHTTLLIGMSFSDITQRVFYKDNRDELPGNIHYHLEYLPVAADATLDQRRRIRTIARDRARSNFRAFGVFSVPLFSEEFSAFFQLLTMDDEHLIDLASELDVPMVYRYYLVGPPGSGKSSVLSHLSSLVTHDEWPDQRPNALARAPDTLTKEENRQLNSWLNKQFRMKNRRLLRAEIGIHVIDRSPLDPLAYQSAAQRPERARELRRELRNPIAPGHVFRFTGKEDVFSLRLIALQKELNPSVIAKIARATDELYKDHGVTIVDTQERTLLEVVRTITELIHLHDKEPKDLESLLADACREGGPTS